VAASLAATLALAFLVIGGWDELEMGVDPRL
jgi:hypothetical protein